MDYKLIRPFSPTIYHGTMSHELLTLLTKSANNSRNAKIDFGHRLAGNIKDQFESVLELEDQSIFMDLISVHLRNYFREEWNRVQYHLINKNSVVPNFENMVFELDSRPWINFQKANEFNPIHSHSGIMSAVLYIEVPEEIAQEALNPLNTNMRCPGQIEFMYGSDLLGVSGTHKIIPKTGDILLFHAGLKHTVYPFTSNVERVSMSFNVKSTGHVI
jgi:hypothetical protein